MNKKHEAGKTYYDFCPKDPGYLHPVGGDKKRHRPDVYWVIRPEVLLEMYNLGHLIGKIEAFITDNLEEIKLKGINSFINKIKNYALDVNNN